MPKPQKNTIYKIGDEGIFPPIIKAYLDEHGLPEAWGSGLDQWQNAEFLSKIAGDPYHFEQLAQGITNYERQIYPFRMFDLYAKAPADFLKFMSFVQDKLHVKKFKEMAAGFLREGAVEHFKKSKRREPTDGELALIFEKQKGIKISGEHFGDARRLLRAQDDDVKSY